MKLFRNTEQFKKWWINRKNWTDGYSGPEALNHPHRQLIVRVLRSFRWLSLMEIGCAAGANLINIAKAIPGRQIGGIDVSPDAIEKAIEVTSAVYRGGFFKVNSADDIMMSDKSTDVILSDAVLIYVDRTKIKKYLKEIKRVSRNHILFCEFHSKSWWSRLALKWKTGYNSYNWIKLLEKNGFYDIYIYKLREQDWAGYPWNKYGYIILARVSKY